ncbi:MAG: hypothetical protein IJD04_01560 [Desulfovibrionaceae bacterium]|nr:hypothetical protein [Desulfovibrionaceae bacterium]
MFWNSLTVIWIIPAALLVVLELFTGSFYLLVLGISAAAAALAAWLGASLPAQLTLAVATGVLGALLVRQRHRQARRNYRPEDDNLELGNPVIWEKTNDDSSWQVSYRGSSWQARPHSQTVDPAGPLRIIEMQGNILIVDNPKGEKNHV